MTILEHHYTPNILLSSCFILGILLAPRDTCKDRLLNKFTYVSVINAMKKCKIPLCETFGQRYLEETET